MAKGKSKPGTNPAPDAAPPDAVPPDAAPPGVRRPGARRPGARRAAPDPAPDPALTARSHGDTGRAARAALARLCGGVSPVAAAGAWQAWALHLARAPGRQIELAGRAQSNSAKLIRYANRRLAGKAAAAPFAPEPQDHRFRHPAWQALPFAIWQQGFLAVQDFWQQATADLPGLGEAQADRAGFMARQMLDAAAPANLPWANPEILAETARRGGRNLTEGAAQFAHDFVRTLTQARAPIPARYRIGEALACTPGKVVMRNDICELIQYAPATARVRPEPILMIPAWIMKYYVLDLSPHNSMVNYLVGQGFTVFMLSWVNPSADQAELSLGDYRRRGVMAALDAIGAIVPGARIHANGYCLGGTLLAIAAAAMARDGDARLASLTLMAAQLDFTETGDLMLFLDETQVAFLEVLMSDQGYLVRPQLAGNLTAIRARDLIWSRAVRRYFLGGLDLPADLGVWSGDTTRMPARMHSQYLRGLFLENRLARGLFAVAGRTIALGDIPAPLFVVAAEADHIAPWRSVYETRALTASEMTFVLAKGGHNGAILSQPGRPARHYRIGRLPPAGLAAGPDRWRAGHPPGDGSWWPALAHWLHAHSGARTDPPATGAPQAGYAVLDDAPGRYVHAA